MSPFPQPLASVAAPLLQDNVDTDIIIPSREMRFTGRTGLADGLFAPWRYSDADNRTPNPDFVLNQPAHRHAAILLGGANFGCGSSREHAVWALGEWGFRAVLAESIAPIFMSNCLRNGILAAPLPRPVLEALASQQVRIDLAAQTVQAGGRTYSFAIDAEAKEMLMHGLDAIDLTLQQSSEIARWTCQDRQERPWVYLGQVR
ncbi:3-isopropylmalate dehydratase small subunit [Porphyrobacter sp. GA68]|uniref:3-isopropylmalate dehydratase small subunit n=1 Tax=Porphyrobacter sp. GA68 TaxID=2883480 RepID=UPI001D19641E|nr:3-isopropylmalate dehydratase small subunit [Porphyrobacter sp. GA68]